MPTADNEVAFELEGEGKLIGMDSGDPASYENYKSNHRRAFHGLALAIVQSTGKPGQIQVKATSVSLKAASATVATKTVPTKAIALDHH